MNVFKYLEPLWTGKDGKISLRNLGAGALIVDFIINLHNSAAIVPKIVKLYMIDKAIDPAAIAAMSGNVAQVNLMLVTEAGLIAALLALRTWQNQKESFFQPNNTTVVTPVEPQPMNQQPIEQVN